MGHVRQNRPARKSESTSRITKIRSVSASLWIAPLKAQCTPGKQRRISRWEHEAVLETVQDRLDRNPEKMRVRRQTVEHPFGTIKAWMGATHFQMRRLPKVASEMALHVLAYNMKRVMQILGVCGLMAAMRA